MWKMLSREQIQEALDSSPTLGAAAQYLKVDWRTFKKTAEEYGMYNKRRGSSKKMELKDILAGKHPQYQTSKLSKRLVKEGLKKYCCEVCGIVEWNGKQISLELNHIDGSNANHSLENLQLICPNCHSQTDTYRSKKLKLEG
jgi:5-methylcytosine-specific restriction endonuclease McrA